MLRVRLLYAALILTPIFSAFFGPAVAVPTLGLVDFTMGSPMAYRALRRCHWPEVLPLIPHGRVDGFGGVPDYNAEVTVSPASDATW